ncbi:MAG: hypothetical protein K4571_00555 [Deltaproteobacteria bacterium]
MRQRILRTITCLVVFFFVWSMGGLFNIAYAAYHEIKKPASQSSRPQTAEEKFQKAIDDLKEVVVAKSSSKAKKGPAARIAGLFENKRSKLREKRSEIESLDKEFKIQFAATEKKLKDAGLPEEILQRHYKFVQHYNDNFKELKASLDAADKAKTDNDFEISAQKVRSHLEKTSFKKKHTPLDPNKLPHRISDIKRKEPRTKPEEFLNDLKQTADAIPSQPINSDHFLSLRATAGSAAISSDQTGLDIDPLNIREYLDTVVLSVINNTVIPAEAGIQEYSTNNHPLLLASNGPMTGLTESLPKFERDITANIPTFQKMDKRGFSADNESPIILAQAGNPPSDADLAETIDVQLTPAIKAKAAELGYSPVKIYNWVRNNVEYVPTYGSIQGADMCLQTLQGNDFDIASLLIALLRASNIHARYVYGTIELPIDKVMNWTGGFTSANAALTFIASGGTPVGAIISGGRISSARLEHVWVEAYINYAPSRGARHITGKGDTWIPLDASYKQYEYIVPADIKNVISTDMQALTEQLKNSATVSNDSTSVTSMNAALVQQAMDSAKQELKAHVQNSPDMKVSDLTGGKKIISQTFPLLPNTLPYNVKAIGSRMSDLTNNFRHTIKIEILDSYGYDKTLSFQAPTASLGNKRITLSYHPAYASDVQTLNSYGGLLKTPCYLVNMKSVLKIDGVNKVAGSLNINPGTEQPLQITISSPGIGTEVINTKITAGDYKAIVFNLGHASTVELEKQRDTFALLKERINANEIINADDLIGGSLHVTGLNYWLQLEMNNAISANHSGVVRTQLLSEGIFSHDVLVNYLYGVPRSITDGGMNVDVAHNLTATMAKDGNSDKARNYVYAAGYFSSAMEHGTLEMIHQTKAISAVKAIAEANQRGIPIFRITSANANIILPQLSIDQDAKTNITNALNAGKEVIVPQTEITLNNWTGTGYIIYDPTTGAGAYMIGGLGGAFEIIDSVMDDMQRLVAFVGGITDDFVEAFARIILETTDLAVIANNVGDKLILISVLVDVYKAIRAGLSLGNGTAYVLSSVALNFMIDYMIYTMFSVALALFVINPILGVLAIVFAASLAVLFTYLVSDLLTNLLGVLSGLFDKTKTMFARLYIKEVIA